MNNKCTKCEVELLTDAEFEKKKPKSSGGLGVMDMSNFFDLSKARNAIGVACAGCMENMENPTRSVEGWAASIAGGG